jgi:drug/metabolite transporter (DMT)-like permease
VSNTSQSAVPNKLSDLAPGIVAAVSFSLTDTFAKVALINGADVLTLSTFRSVVVLCFMAVWFRMTDKPPAPATPRQRWIALGVGLLFCGIVFGLYKAIQYLPVSIAILSYFVYPLATGLIGALLGIDNVSWRGIAAATVAFLGLALTVGAEPGGIVLAGLALAGMAACCRVGILLVSRAFLQGIDARLTTWYSFVATSVVFSAFSLATWNWNAPHNAWGWTAFAIVTVATFSAVWTLFVSISRIGPFRSALIMNLEPLLATIISVPLVGEVLTPLQMLGGSIMIAALVAFQMRR